MKNKNPKKEAQCPGCDYRWGTRSIMKNVTCPNCLLKFIPAIQDSAEEKKEEIKNDQIS